jgi:hypothetical protein
LGLDKDGHQSRRAMMQEWADLTEEMAEERSRIIPGRFAQAQKSNLSSA